MMMPQLYDFLQLSLTFFGKIYLSRNRICLRNISLKLQETIIKPAHKRDTRLNNFDAICSRESLKTYLLSKTSKNQYYLTYKLQRHNNSSLYLQIMSFSGQWTSKLAFLKKIKKNIAFITKPNMMLQGMIIINRELSKKLISKYMYSSCYSTILLNFTFMKKQQNLYNAWAFVTIESMIIFQPQFMKNNIKSIKNSKHIPQISICIDILCLITLRILVVLLIEGFLLDYIIIFKKKFQNLMSFLYFINNGFATVATVEQFQGYYQNLGSYYSNNDQLYISTNYPQTWTQSQVYAQCDSIPVPVTQVPKEDIQIPTIKTTSTGQKPKKRMEKTTEKEILSAKKNSQSNIINQFYSFFSSRQKSEKIVEKCAFLMEKSAQQVEKILSIFYMTIRFINAKRGRKYVNVSMFLKFFTPEEFGEYLSEMKEKIDQLDYLNVQQLCQIFRRCAKYFLKEISINAILTSKRISVVSKEEHLKKRRKILRTIMGN